MTQFEHIRCPLHRYTFTVRPMRDWVEKVCEKQVLNLFAGAAKLNIDEIRNDLNPEMPAAYHQDALTFLRQWQGKRFQTILLDPPYAYRKSMELYQGMVYSPFRQLKDEAVHCLRPGGLVITFGYHSVVMGRGRKFRLERLALFSHGGAIHDTIAAVERFNHRKMSNNIYQINKGVNASIEFKGLKAQYIGYFAGLLLALLVGFAILYIAGVAAYLCIVIVGGTGGYGAFKLYRLSHVHGPHGLTKLMARKRLPQALRAYNRRMYY